MEKPLSIFVGTTNHVPFGADDGEFEMVYTRKLKPFIIALNNFPKIKAALHYSGVLLHWIEKAHPEFLMLIGELVSRRQVELIGGGFYEPLFPLIPAQDRIGQIEMLTTYIRKQFGKRPLGCWLPAAAWDQSLVGTLNTCGMAYTFLREEQFLQAGLSGEDLYAPCVTEDQGKLLTVIPVLRRLTREAKAGSVFSLLEQEAARTPSGAGRLITLCPDCFAEDHDAEETGLTRFFEDLARAEPFADFITPSAVARIKRRRTRAYFPPSSELSFAGKDPKGAASPTMASPSMASPSMASPLPAKTPKQLLLRYPEANGIYAKVMHTHLLIHQLRGDKARKQSAQEELWKGQGYAAFCHTEGGGIFRNTVRNAAYRALVEAERTTRKRGVFIPSLMTFDFDLDGEDEYLFQVEHINCYVKARGAAIFEFDFIPRSWNYLDTFSAPSDSASVPAARRMSFADMLAPVSIPLAALAGTDGIPGGVRVCSGEDWDAGGADKVKKKAAFLLGPRADGPFAAAALRKEYHLKRDSLTVRYTITNRGAEQLICNFIPRIDLSFPGEDDRCLRIFRLLPQGESPSKDTEKSAPPVSREALVPDPSGVITGSASAVEFQDLKNEVIITLTADRIFNAAIVPVRVPAPVYGTETPLYQSTCLLPAQTLDLAPDAAFTAEFILKLLSH
ncbi:MAG: DUF1925 domain-containing protein [Spirochaetaceae bacterium]|jgi:hypothetical protein|nr:DUF1925 domain-containing protein [Spirochaetaceae bacterium]